MLQTASVRTWAGSTWGHVTGPRQVSSVSDGISSTHGNTATSSSPEHRTTAETRLSRTPGFRGATPQKPTTHGTTAISLNAVSFTVHGLMLEN